LDLFCFRETLPARLMAGLPIWVVENAVLTLNERLFTFLRTSAFSPGLTLYPKGDSIFTGNCFGRAESYILIYMAYLLFTRVWQRGGRSDTGHLLP
jgi:hypothetical protein